MSDRAAPGMIRVVSSRYDGSPRDEWPAQLLERDGTRLLLSVAAGTEEIVRGRRRQRIVDPYLAIYWTDRWYNVWQFDREKGVRFYANVAMPCTLDGAVLRWVDLDMDVIRNADGSTVLRDEREFQERSASMRYPPEVIQAALAARDELLRLAQAGEFPFSRWGAG